jgi:hypothetical protein
MPAWRITPGDPLEIHQQPESQCQLGVDPR